MSACPVLAEEQYMRRHDRVCAALYCNLCEETGVQLEKEHWYVHVVRRAEKVLEREVIIVWNQQVQTDRAIPNNRPDIIMRDNEKGNMYVSGCWKFSRQKCDEERKRYDCKM